MKKILESGAIPDAAVIHAARKRRQRARELGGDFVPIEEEETEDTGGRLRREEDQDEGSDEERIDMDANPAIRDHVRVYPVKYCLIQRYERAFVGEETRTVLSSSGVGRRG